MSDTPETDAQPRIFMSVNCGLDEVVGVDVDFARRLERERNIASEQRDRLLEVMNEIHEWARDGAFPNNQNLYRIVQCARAAIANAKENQP